jgi:hypothetical protein
VETCSNGVCSRPATPGCKACTTAADCTDANTCTTDTCDGGVCGNHAVANCKPCTTATDCNDSNPCTADACGADRSCQLTTIDGCRLCTTAADCDDADACTTDVCTAGACEARPIEGCGVEHCTNGIDDDGDGATDCADSDCADDAACAVEICGDCQDNDGDGLVDYEDPDCCEVTDTLTLRKMAMRMRPQLGRNSLRLRGRYLTAGTASFDPTRDGVTLQIADRDGQIYCHDLPVRASKRGLKRGVFRFRDRTGTQAGGLRTVRFKIRKDGRVVFRAKGRKMQFRSPAGSDVDVTLRVGGQCTQTTAALRTRSNHSGTRILFP